MLVNRNLEILCSYGPTQDYLTLPQGKTSLVLLDMVNADYRNHLRAVTHRAFRYGEQNDITARLKGDHEQNLLITARPLQQPEEVRGLALITFEPLSGAMPPSPGEADSDPGQQLNEELEATRNELHNIAALAGGSWEMVLDPEAPEQLPDSIFLSIQLKNLLGFHDDQMPNSLQAWTERILPSDRRHFKDIFQRQNPSARPLHYRICHRDDSIRWFASYSRIIHNAQGQPVRWLGIDCDITDYKQAEIRARHIQSQLRLLTDTLPEMLIFLDPQYHIHFSNATFNNWIGSNTRDVLGRNLTELLDKALFERLTPCIDIALAGQTISHGVDLNYPDLGQCHFQASYIPHIAEGEVLGCCVILIRKSQVNGAADNEKEQEKLTYIQRMATIGEMASTLAHDLRQPLGAINSYASGLMRMLNNGQPAEKTTPIVRKIANQVERADDIVDNVRGFISRQADGYEPVNLNVLLQKVLSLSNSRARKMGVDMRYTEAPPLPEVKGDSVQLQQVLINLINNAMEAMQVNGPEKQRVLWLMIEEPEAGFIQLVVEDSGPGIPAERIETVFDSCNTTKLEGMGMGLAISRSIVEWHGGRLWAESQPGRGARFCLSLPVMADQSGNTEAQ